MSDIDPAPRVGGRVRPLDAEQRGLPEKTRRFILTSAQNNTHIYEDAWYNLLALAEYYDAEVLVSRFTYDKSSYGQKSIKPDTVQADDFDDLWYDPAIGPYVCDRRVELAPGLVWCGELNILPTARDPLSGLKAYSGRASSIVPHAKFAMTSVAAGKNEATKFLYATGTVTQRNYIQKKIGLQAEQEHGYGGLIVEVTPEGHWFVRQLQVGPLGSIQDLDLLAKDGEVTEGHTVEAISWGDVHRRVIDNGVAWIAATVWDRGTLFFTRRTDVQLPDRTRSSCRDPQIPALHEQLRWPSQERLSPPARESP